MNMNKLEGKNCTDHGRLVGLIYGPTCAGKLGIPRQTLE